MFFASYLKLLDFCKIRKYNKYAVIITAFAADFGIQVNGLEDDFFRKISVNEDVYEYEKWFHDIFMQIKHQAELNKNNQIVRDQLKFDIKVCLIKNGYPPQYSPEVFRKVMEQVENFEENN